MARSNPRPTASAGPLRVHRPGLSVRLDEALRPEWGGAVTAAWTKRPLARCCGAGESRARRTIGRRNLVSRQLRRRSAIRPNPPIAINSQVDGSGTALTSIAPSEPKDASGELGPDTMMP